ncbi:MAG: hypothetical protein US39_C0004G0058 [Microgenomates group bacterium GW2011_GWC1_37_12b]|nr:MAG: hypothetical protein US39_C0004G0058 [Microgenomates group bacterium GW2011_GWC1_37_12b]
MKKIIVSAVIVTMNRKDELIDCIDSLIKSKCIFSEIVVVDNGSKIPTKSFLSKKFPKVKIIRSEVNIGAAAGRNLGIKNVNGDFIFFMDDDAVIDNMAICQMLEVFKKYKNVGLVQPKVYDKDQPTVIQGAGHTINLMTGRAKAWGIMEPDHGQYDNDREIPMTGGIVLVKKSVIKKIGVFDEDYFIPYEDSDLCMRATKAGFKVYCSGEAKSWHQGKKATAVNPRLEWMGVTTPERAYRIARNKIIFMRKHAPLANKVIFMLVILPFYALAHSAIIVSSNRFDIFFNYWKGLFSGLLYFLTYKPKQKYA